jgi:hypothetical protein
VSATRTFPPPPKKTTPAHPRLQQQASSSAAAREAELNERLMDLTAFVDVVTAYSLDRRVVEGEVRVRACVGGFVCVHVCEKG